jgi:hypothetical protein
MFSSAYRELSISSPAVPTTPCTFPLTLGDLERIDMTGKTGATASYWDISGATAGLVEYQRRKPGASGTPVTLADGHRWLLANPTYRPRPEGLTQPLVDQPVDAIFECSVLNTSLPFSGICELARRLLKANYELTDDEVSQLLSVPAGAESGALAEGILTAVFGADQGEKTYTSWVRASLLAGGLSDVEISARDLAHVLAILVATNRTIPLSAFADACRLADTRARLETLI